MNKFLRKRRKGGFTLIELIVVIAILGILAAIAIPRFTGFTAKANVAADHQYGQLIGNAITVLLAEGKITGDTVVTVSAAAGNTGSFVVTSGGAAGSGVALVDNDARVTALVANKKTAGTTNIVVTVTGAGVVSVTP